MQAAKIIIEDKIITLKEKWNNFLYKFNKADWIIIQKAWWKIIALPAIIGAILFWVGYNTSYQDILFNYGFKFEYPIFFTIGIYISCGIFYLTFYIIDNFKTILNEFNK